MALAMRTLQRLRMRSLWGCSRLLTSAAPDKTLRTAILKVRACAHLMGGECGLAGVGLAGLVFFWDLRGATVSARNVVVIGRVW